SPYRLSLQRQPAVRLVSPHHSWRPRRSQSRLPAGPARFSTSPDLCSTITLHCFLPASSSKSISFRLRSRSTGTLCPPVRLVARLSHLESILRGRPSRPMSETICHPSPS